jgi:DNA-directed RNA polymerase specialized sigma24 family protein
MSISVTDVLSAPPTAAPDYSPAPAPAAAAPTTSGIASSTIVDLSESTQALTLQQQGQSPAEIAQTLGISVAAVDGYLGIAVPTVAPTPAPVQATPTTQSPAPEPVAHAKA